MPNREEQTTICVNQSTKDRLMQWRPEGIHRSWDDLLIDLLEVAEDAIR